MAKKRSSGPDLRADLRQFIGEHPDGWDHGEWLTLLHRLREMGHATDEPDRIGELLERERWETGTATATRPRRGRREPLPDVR